MLSYSFKMNSLWLDNKLFMLWICLQTIRKTMISFEFYSVIFLPIIRCIFNLSYQGIDLKISIFSLCISWEILIDCLLNSPFSSSTAKRASNWWARKLVMMVIVFISLLWCNALIFYLFDTVAIYTCLQNYFLTRSSTQTYFLTDIL